MIRQLNTLVVWQIQWFFHEHHLLAILLPRLVLVLFQNPLKFSILHSALELTFLGCAVPLCLSVLILLFLRLLCLLLVLISIHGISFYLSFSVLLLLEFEFP